ncbi:unnamed protein product [Clonostachys rosea]|uniref:Transcription factor domain-containing protein n=1 Tax=Bionectria ochroleuca TaxID=29856 RepID=A0ABY6TZR6_BIOOC|nr:unnamed protein product [Clonostachys rosea]
MALKLLISLKSQIRSYSDQCLVQGIRQACRFLCVAEAVYVAGPKIHSSSLGIATQPVTFQQSSESSPARDEHLFDKEKRLLLDVLGLWRRITRFTQRDVTLSAPAPWAQGSEFWSLKRVLDSLPVAYYTYFCFDQEKLQCPPGEENDLGEYLFYIGMLHTLQMLLHRVFLPISVATKAVGLSGQKPTHIEPDDADIQQQDPRQNINRRTSARSTVAFPGAPRLFLEERVAACVRTGLIFLNQLYTETVPEALDEHVENLKTVFMILSALREFYTPAHVWVESLFQVHSLAQPSELSVILNKKAFSHFFSRFSGMVESPFCPLELGHSVLEQAMSSSTIDISHLLQPRTLSDRDLDMDSETSETSQILADDYPGWLNDYQTQLGLINSN